MSSRQLKMYLRASLDLIPVSPSWSSGVCRETQSRCCSPNQSHFPPFWIGTIYIRAITALCCRCTAGPSRPSKQPRGDSQNTNLTSRGEEHINKYVFWGGQMHTSAIWAWTHSYGNHMKSHKQAHKHMWRSLRQRKTNLCWLERTSCAHDILNYGEGSGAAGVTRNHMAEVVPGSGSSAQDDWKELGMPGGVASRRGRSRQVRGASWQSLSQPP